MKKDKSTLSEQSPQEAVPQASGSSWKESLYSLFWAILVALFARGCVMEAFKIPSGSMIPSLQIGDQLFVNKAAYGPRIPFTAIRLWEWSSPKRGDVVVFISPKEPYEDFIKRVIGLPGDTIAVRQGELVINDEVVPRVFQGEKTFMERDLQTSRWYPIAAQVFQETLGEHQYQVLHDLRFSLKTFGPVKVPEGHVFVMGDNRDNSSDSRFWGTVPKERLLGPTLFIWWSWGKDGLVTDRIFSRVP